MRKIRLGTFETNSSSTHAVVYRPGFPSTFLLEEDDSVINKKYTHKDDGVRVKIDGYNVDIEFSDLSCKTETILFTFIERLRYLLALALSVYGNDKGEWPLMYHAGFWNSKLGKLFMKEIKKSNKSYYKLRSIKFVPSGYKYSQSYLKKEPLRFLAEARKYTISPDKKEQDKYVKESKEKMERILKNPGDYIYCELDHGVVETAYDSISKTGKLDSCLGGFSVGELLFKDNLKIMYTRDG